MYSRAQRWTVLLATLALVATLPLVGASPTAKPEDVGMSSDRLQQVNALMRRNIEAKTFAGAVTLVARHGRVAHLQAHGLMDLESRRPMQTDAVFRIMSMTKPIVGVAVLMMIEEGKVRLTDPASRFVPELKGLKVAVPGTPQFSTVAADHDITVRELLTHTSGLVSGTISSAEARAVALKPGERLADYLPRLAGVPLEFQPGSRWGYSGLAGFDLLARIVEVSSGQPFDQFLKNRIFEPLGMSDTFFAPVDGHPRLATAYRRADDGALVRQTNPNFLNGSYFSGGGGLMSTAEDYFQFGQMLLNGGQLNGKRLLSPRSVEVMRSVFVPDTLPGRAAGEGFGLSVRVVSNPQARNTFLSQGSFGWSGAYGTHFWVDPKEKIVAILMIHTPAQQARADFESAVAHAVVEPVPASLGTH